VLASEESEDGFLTSSEAAELSLDSELAVLSACKTGVGDYVTGEGVMGMSRAFLIAGSRAVLMSLWQVDSAATEELVVAFYSRLMSGSTAAVALREAKQLFVEGPDPAAAEEARPSSPRLARSRGIKKLPREPDASESRLTLYPHRPHPFYWAGFVLIGG
jgi:CHAT domain-containing protein